MQVMLIRTEANPVMIDVPHDLQSFQRLVGGMIEVAEPFQDDAVVLVCDESGRDKGKAVNRVVNDRMDICGDFFLCGQKDDQLCDFPVDRENYYNAMFHLAV